MAKIIEEKRNYIIEKINEVPSSAKDVKYRRKVVYDKDGYRHILNIAIYKTKNNKRKTLVTSIWHPKEEPKAKELARKHRRQLINLVKRRKK